jgi:hypothetical protein
MKKTFGLLAVIAVCNTAGTCNLVPPDSVIRAEITPEELEAQPGYHQMKGALLNDIRVWRELDKKVADEGVREVPTPFTLVQGIPTCGTDKTEFEVYRLKEDLIDQPYRIDETAYLCRKEKLYYYHYQGGPRKLDVWMGPYKLDRKRIKPDER